MTERIYDTPEWAELRELALERDGHRCTVARLIGGECSARLHVHHLIPVADGGPELPDLDGVLTTCARHHPTLEALRRYLIRRRTVPACRHNHRYDHAREECRARRERVLA